ncbi:MAG: hypothetical protein GY937_22880 [bacterium]|nr:hypothetical protein [bacterium]
MAIHDDGREMQNAAITLEIPGLGVCDIREFTWNDILKTRRIVEAQGVDGVSIEMADGDEVERATLDNMVRMFATATVAIQRTLPATTFETVADLFRPRDEEAMSLLTRVIAITATGREPSPTAEEAGNYPPGQGE